MVPKLRFPSFLSKRQTPPTNNGTSDSPIDFSNLPECARESCFPFHAPSIGCQNLTSDCFCDSFQPLGCARWDCRLPEEERAIDDFVANLCDKDSLKVSLEPLERCDKTCLRPLFTESCEVTEDPVTDEGMINSNCLCRISGIAFVSDNSKIVQCLERSSDLTCDNSTVAAWENTYEFWRGICVTDREEFPPNSTVNGTDISYEVIESPNETVPVWTTTMWKGSWSSSTSTYTPEPDTPTAAAGRGGGSSFPTGAIVGMTLGILVFLIAFCVGIRIFRDKKKEEEERVRGNTLPVQQLETRRSIGTPNMRAHDLTLFANL